MPRSPLSLLGVALGALLPGAAGTAAAQGVTLTLLDPDGAQGSVAYGPDAQHG